MENQGPAPSKNILGFLIFAAAVFGTSIGIGFLWFYVLGLTYSMWFPILSGIVGFAVILALYPVLSRRGML